MPDPSTGRVRVTISLTKEIATLIDETVDGSRIRNRSHAIETLVTESLHVAQIRQAVILAGGEQALKRVRAYQQMLKTFRENGIYEVTVAVGFLGEKLKSQLGTGEEYGMKISYAQSELGTGGALLQLRNRLGKQCFLVANIDRPVELDLKNLIKFHREHGPLVTIATRTLTELTGVYVMDAKVFQHIPAGFCMLEDTVFHEMTKQGKLLPYPILRDHTDTKF
jgi:NDP-sugar pyrophosphorylase family protein